MHIVLWVYFVGFKYRELQYHCEICTLEEYTVCMQPGGMGWQIIGWAIIRAG